MKLTFLRSADNTPLTKTFEKRNKVLTKHSYPHVLNFSSYDIEIKTLEQFYAALSEASKDKATCLLKGNVLKKLDNERRAGSTDPMALTHFLCLDFDGHPDYKTAGEILKRVGLGGISYIEQMSCSAGIDLERGLSSHVFMMLKEPVFPAMLKLWLMALNLRYPALKDHLTLNKSFTAIKWPLDISTCQNDKLIYIANPICKGFRAPKIERLVLHDERKQYVSVDTTTLGQAEIYGERLKAVNALRKIEGMSTKRSYKLKAIGEMEVLTNPDACEITGVKQDRGFTYLNLNGGDSWGYYFPIDNPEFVHNFKGEPTYMLKDLSPEYYNSYLEELGAKPEVPDAEGMIYTIGLELESDRFMRIAHDNTSNDTHVTFTGARVNAFDFLKQHGQPKPDYVPTWTTKYDFFCDGGVDFEKREINLYRDSIYIRNHKKIERLTIPPTIKKVVDHVFAYDKKIIDHFLNWISVIIQQKRQTMTAWVIGGTQGTGKGVLFHRILNPIIGPDYCKKTKLMSFEKEFNAFAEQSLLLYVDEVQISEVRQRSTAMAAIKELITEPNIGIRRMRTDLYMATNSLNFIFASNKFDPIEIDPEDRRFNVSPRQETALRDVISIDSIEDKIAGELQDFTNYIMSRKASLSKARSIMHTPERERLQRATENTTMSVANKIRNGDFEFFLDIFLSTKESTTEFEIASRIKNAPSLKDVLEYMYKHKKKECRLPRDYLAVMFFYAVDIAKTTSHGFSKFLGRHGFNIEVLAINGIPTRGVRINKIIVSKEAEQQWQEIHSPEIVRLVK